MLYALEAPLVRRACSANFFAIRSLVSRIVCLCIFRHKSPVRAAKLGCLTIGAKSKSFGDPNESLHPGLQDGCRFHACRNARTSASERSAQICCQAHSPARPMMRAFCMHATCSSESRVRLYWVRQGWPFFAVDSFAGRWHGCVGRTDYARGDEISAPLATRDRRQ